jgi:hypothetical protein
MELVRVHPALLMRKCFIAYAQHTTTPLTMWPLATLLPGLSCYALCAIFATVRVFPEWLQSMASPGVA